MSRDPDRDEPDPGQDPDREPDRDPRGTLRSTTPGVLATFAGIGLVVGWAIRPVALRVGSTEPRVSWASIGLIWFLAAIVGGAAYFTWRTFHDRLRIEPHRAVNRLVLGKACALVGALLAGGYFGFALAHLGAASENAGPQLWRAIAAGVGGLVTMIAALLLEQACRIREDDD